MNNYLKKIFLYILLTLINIVPVFANKSALINDVDSIGDLWIFALDKTGSMLSERVDPYRRVRINPQDIADDVIKRLNREDGILDCIDYTQDKIAIYETGYGSSKEDSYGHRFDCAESLDKSFIHIVQTPQPFKTNGKKGLMRVLRDKLERGNYVYQESFVSQIRVLILSRIVDYIKENDLGNSFRNIHLVIVTDDADENDQWKTDYYAIKFRSKKKFEELNALHSKYIYSSFTQLGGGYLEERSDKTDISAAKHIYLYDYVTLQQKDKKVEGVDFVKIAPLDGSCINVKVILNEYESDEIDFVYIESLKINNQELPINRYITDTSSILINYDNGVCKNDVEIKGQVQLQYVDSIYGAHAKKIDFETHCVVLPQGIRIFINVLYIILATFIVLTIIFFVWILPNKCLMNVYMSNGHELHVHRGYHWQWSHDIISLISVQRHSPTNQAIFIKHCNITSHSSDKTDVNEISFLISSRRPLSVTPNAKEFTSFSDINADYHLRSNEYPSLLRTHYNKSTIARLYQKRKSIHIKSLKYLLQICINIVNHYAPVYYYFIDKDISDKTYSISSKHLFGKVFLIELKYAGNIHTSPIDIATNTIVTRYYDNPSAEYADCLIRYQIHSVQKTIEWYVIRLQHDYISSHSIRTVRLIMHYIQPIDQIDGELIHHIAQQLKKECRKLQGVRKINIGKESPNISNLNHFQFDISHSSILNFVSVVESTENPKSTTIYSPFEDSNTFLKYVMIHHSENDALLYSSPIRFDKCIEHPSLQYRLSPNIFYHDSIHDRTERLLIDDDSIQFSNILINPNNISTR